MSVIFEWKLLLLYQRNVKFLTSNEIQKSLNLSSVPSKRKCFCSASEMAVSADIVCCKKNKYFEYAILDAWSWKENKLAISWWLHQWYITFSSNLDSCNSLCRRVEKIETGVVQHKSRNRYGRFSNFVSKRLTIYSVEEVLVEVVRI